jgi:hypothetical protein
MWIELRYLSLPSNTLTGKNSGEKLGRRLPARLSASGTPNQVQDVIIGWHRDTTDPMEIDLLDLSYPSDHYVTKMPSWLANNYTSLTEQLTAIEKLVSKSVTRDRLATAAFPILIAQYWQLLEQQHMIYTNWLKKTSLSLRGCRTTSIPYCSRALRTLPAK